MGRYGKQRTVCKYVTKSDRIRQGIIYKQGKELQEGQKSWKGNFKDVKLGTTRGHEIATL